jgi:D-alanyl-D-alanine carboxypeptidase/D-alanyl-D-alanine-endopeptidase (penicillin-binding protein 4)
MVVAAALVTVIGVAVGALSSSALQAEPRWLAGTVGAADPAPVLAALNDDAPAPSADALADRIDGLLDDNRLGSHVTASVVDVSTGDLLYDDGGDTPVVPASTTKLATGAAVLASRGPAYRIATRVVAGAEPGEVVIIGGGDSTLAVGSKSSYPGAARLDKLAAQVKKALGGTAPTKVTVDVSLYEGPTFSPAWISADLSAGYIANVTALMTNGARREPTSATQAARFDKPDLAAGQQFAKLLGLPASAVTVTDAAIDPDAEELGKVLSPPIANLVELMLLTSDNVLAEALARQVAVARGLPASFTGGAEATRDALTELGLSTSGFDLVDGSGMSHQNRLSAHLLTSIVAQAARDDQPALKPLITGLPVAAYSGTLTGRYQSSSSGKSAAGVVRAKTGTLTGVTTLAGLAVDADGRLLAFSIMADQADEQAGKAALDRVAAAIAGCGCS